MKEKLGLELERAIQAYLDAHKDMDTLMLVGPADWKRAHIRARRDAYEFILTFNRIGSAVEATDAPSDLLASYTYELGQLRHSITLHQSDWPVVTIDPANAEYSRSLKELRSARDAFLVTARRLAATLRERG